MERIEYQEHLARLPALTRAFHMVLNVLKIAVFALILGIFIKAVIVSINWRTVNPLEITLWWMLFASLTGLPGMLIIGLDAILIRAIAPLPFGKGANRLTSGKKAVIFGAFSIIGGLVWTTIWAGIGYGALTNQYNIIEFFVNVLANLIAIVVVVSILANVFRNLINKFFQTDIVERISKEQDSQS